MFTKIQTETYFSTAAQNWWTSFKIREMSEYAEYAMGRACSMKRKGTTNGRKRTECYRTLSTIWFEFHAASVCAKKG